MSTLLVYAIIVNGAEVKRRIRIKDARYHANKLREVHGKYNVWLRPHYELVSVA